MLSTPPAFILSQDQTLVKISQIRFNTNLKSSSFQFKKTTSFLIPFTVLRFDIKCLFWIILFRIFRVVVYCLIIKVLFVSPFKFGLFSLSYSLTFVKNFFNLFSTSFSAVRPLSSRQTFVCLKRQLIKNIIISCVCQLLFYSFLNQLLLIQKIIHHLKH